MGHESSQGAEIRRKYAEAECTENISDLRQRGENEITPIRAEHSRTRNNDEINNGAKLAIDANLDTASYTMANDEGKYWIKLTLEQAYCVDKVVWFYGNGAPLETWTCTEKDCSECKSNGCIDFPLTVSIEGAGSDLSSVLNCRYGDTVKLERKDGKSLHILEIAIFEKEGKSITIYKQLSHLVPTKSLA